MNIYTHAEVRTTTNVGHLDPTLDGDAGDTFGVELVLRCDSAQCTTNGKDSIERFYGSLRIDLPTAERLLVQLASAVGEAHEAERRHVQRQLARRALEQAS